MDEKSMNQNAGLSADQGTGDKRTFSQEDVNRIVQERLAKEKAKSSGEADFTKREQELARRELHMSAKELLSEKGLPIQIYEALNCTDRETMEKSIATIEKYFKECRANATSNIKFRGFQPGASHIMPSAEASGDLEIRKAMGLST